MVLILDTETTGLPRNMNAPHTDTDNWPHMLSVAWEVYTNEGKLHSKEAFIVAPRPGVVNSPEALAVNKITPEVQKVEGVGIERVMKRLESAFFYTDLIVAHNVVFDKNIIGAEFARIGVGMWVRKWFCTKENVGNLLQLPPTPAQREYRPEIEYKQPSLNELYQFLFGKPVPGREQSHGARQDAAACAECYWELKRRNLI